ncbi:MAG: VanZ family protein [Candidatus Omnitrophica bacterium]|nr:VanZ family protein [Candidatus Omnitrophota bacterium]
MLNFLRFWFPVILYSGIIFYVSGQPNVAISWDIPNIDKVVHAIEYAILGFLTTRAVFGTVPDGSNWRILYICGIFLAILYGLSDEYHQAFVPGRTSSAADFLADSLGAILGAWIYWVRGNLIKKNKLRS